MSYGNKPNEIRHPMAALLTEGYVTQRIQSLGYTADLNSEEVNQLTDANVVEVVDSDPTVSLTIDINEFGSINIYNQLAGFYTAGENTNGNDGTIPHTFFGEIATDFLVAIKESSTATTQSRALWFNNCSVDSISGTYQVDGFASESISLTGSNQRWFLNDWAGVRVGMGTIITGTSGRIDCTATDGSVIYVTEDGILLNNTYWEQAGQAAPIGNDITAAGGYAFSTSSRYRYVYEPGTNSFPSIANDGASPVGGVKEGEIEIIVWDNTHNTEPGIGTSGSSWSKMLRVQSVDYELGYDREDLKQLYTGTYYKGLNDYNITTTISVLDSDLETWAMTTGNWAGWSTSNSDVSTFALTDFQNMSSLSMRVDVFNTKDYLLHAGGTLLKSITFHDGKVTSVGDSRDVPGRGTQSIDIEFQRAHFKGTGNTGR